jgi:hypothetical protein
MEARLVAAFSLALCASALTGAARAQTTWYVDATAVPPGDGSAAAPYASLQYALRQAATQAGDTVLVLPGIYQEPHDFLGKGVAVRSVAGPAATVLRGEANASPPYSVVSFVHGEDASAVLEGFTIEGGNGTLVGAERFGGGVYIADASPTLVGCILTQNRADHGHGLYASNSEVKLASCVLRDNGPPVPEPATGLGGGARFVLSSPELERCELSANSAAQGAGASFQAGRPRLTDCLVAGNRASERGGGIALDVIAYGDTVAERTRFEDNSVENGPGGALVTDYSCYVMLDCSFLRNEARGGNDGGAVHGTSCFASFSDCTFEQNSARSGGGLWFENVLGAGFTRCRIAHNSGGGLYAVGCLVHVIASEVAWNRTAEPNFGGGLHVVRTDLRLTGTTLHHNVGGPGAPGGLYFWPTGPDWDALVRHCTFTRNAPAGITAYGYFDLHDSIVWGNLGSEVFLTPYATVSWSDVGGGYAGTGNVDADPLFWLPDAGDLLLQPGSPCIDSGDPAGAPDPDGSRADMGALPFLPGHCPEPTAYCTAKVNSCGALPAIAASGVPSASAASGFVVRASGARAGKAGLLLHGTARASLPFEGSVLCIEPADLHRGLAVFASSGSGGACDAELAIDWNAYAAGALGGHPQAFLRAPGQRVDLQWWGRDTLAHGSLLSDALEYAVCP